MSLLVLIGVFYNYSCIYLNYCNSTSTGISYMLRSFNLNLQLSIVRQFLSYLLAPIQSPEIQNVSLIGDALQVGWPVSDSNT